MRKTKFSSFHKRTSKSSSSSSESRHNPRRSMHKMRRDQKIDEKSLRNIIKRDLGVKLFTFQAFCMFTDRVKWKEKQLMKCWVLLNCLISATNLVVLWSGDEQYSIEQEFYKQNHRILSQNSVTANSQAKNCSKLILSKLLDGVGWITEGDKNPLAFSRHGVKINQKCNQGQILQKKLKLFLNQKPFCVWNWML